MPQLNPIAHSSSENTLYGQMVPSVSSPMIVAGALKHPQGVSRGSNIPTPKSSPLRRPQPTGINDSPVRKLAEEKWIDGPRVSKFKVAEARHMMREINHVKQCETWIDGPNTNPVVGPMPATASGAPVNYGYMDSHKKTMIRQWVENQSNQIQPTGVAVPIQVANTTVQYRQYYMAQHKSGQEDDRSSVGSKADEFVNPLLTQGFTMQNVGTNCSESCIKTGLKNMEYETRDNQSEKSASNVSENPPVPGDHVEQEEDQDSGPSEVPPALPLIEPLGSRDISVEGVHMLCSRHVSRESLSMNQTVTMMDCALQVTEDDIARAMGGYDFILIRV